MWLGFVSDSARKLGWSKKQLNDFSILYKKAPLAKTEIDSIADDIVKKLGGKVAKAPLKSAERAIEKITKDYDGKVRKKSSFFRNNHKKFTNFL